MSEPNFLTIAQPKLAQHIVHGKLLLPHNITFAEWEEVGAWLLAAQEVIDRNATMVRILRADWYRFGCERYGEDRAVQAQAVFGVAARTIANDASELSHVADECREIEGVTFEVLAGARHAPKEVQPELVREAVQQGWGRREVETIARKDGAQWAQGVLLRQMQNAYNRMDDAGRIEFDKWYASVQHTTQQRKASKAARIQ